MSVQKRRDTINFIFRRGLPPNLLLDFQYQFFELRANGSFLDNFALDGLYLCLEVAIAVDDEISLLIEGFKFLLVASLLHPYQNHINHCRNLTPISEPTSIFAALCCFSRMSITLSRISFGCL